MRKLQIENDWIGFLETPAGIREFSSLNYAVESLMRMITDDLKHLIIEFPKSKWSIGYRGDDDKWKTVFSISSATLRKLQKEGFL